MEMSLWLEFRACLCARCAPDSSHRRILKKHAAVESRMWLWLEFRASGGLRGGGSNHCSFMLGASPAHICAEIAIKHKENAVFENPDTQPPVETLVRGL